MSPAIDYDARRGVLVADRSVLEAIATGAADPSLRRRMQAAGLLDGDRPEPGLERLVEALRRPVGGTLAVSYRGRSMQAWIGPRAVAVRPPPHGRDRATLLRLPPSLLPAAVVRAVALEPRPPAPGPCSTEELLTDPSVVRWWRLLYGRPDSDGGTMLEVVDTHGGLRVVDAEGRAHPATGAQVLQWIVRSCSGRSEGLRPLPDDRSELPRPWC